jgi:hypothetical protein
LVDGVGENNAGEPQNVRTDWIFWFRAKEIALSAETLGSKSPRRLALVQGVS